MKCKLFLEEGDYLDKTTLEPRNLLCAERVDTPIGEENTWLEFDTIEEAINYYNLEVIVIEEIKCPRCESIVEPIDTICINCKYDLQNAN